MSGDARRGAGKDRLFVGALWLIGGSYIALILALLVADVLYTTPLHMTQALAKPEIRHAIKVTLASCTISAILSLWVAIPLGYVLSRFRFPGRWLIDTLVDIPLVLPPLVIGLSLLILFHLPSREANLELWLREHIRFTLFGREFQAQVTYAVTGVILAQFTVSAAFAVRTMRITFDQISPRTELVAMTLGSSRAQAFWRVVLPQAWRGMITALTMAWARALGEFGPILVFAGATRNKTEVLSTTVFLELSVGDLQSAVAVSLLMVAIAVLVLLVVRAAGLRGAEIA